MLTAAGFCSAINNPSYQSSICKTLTLAVIDTATKSISAIHLETLQQPPRPCRSPTKLSRRCASETVCQISFADSIEQLIQEIESQAIASQQQIGVVKAQILAKQREIRLLDLTTTELGQIPSDTKVYEGVGKM